MSIKWEEIRQDVLQQIDAVNTKEEIDKLKVDVLGKKGLIAGFMAQMKTSTNFEHKKIWTKSK